ncbi:hypothetical protein HGM15179_021758, partial [Zosterops borbonicus]
EKSEDVIKHLLQAFSFMGIPKTIKTDNGPGYTYREFCSFLQQWGVEPKTGIPHSPTGQAIVERTHQNIKRVLNQQTQIFKLETPQIRLARALFTLNFLNCSFKTMNPPIIRHFSGNKDLKERERTPVLVKDPETTRTEGPHDLITWGRGYACVLTPEGLRWVPAKWVKPYVPRVSGSKNRQVAEASWRRKKKVPDLLQDEEVTRQATIQNRAAIDYLLLLHHHTCEEFEGLCCFSLSSRAEDVRQSIKKIRDMVHDIKEETKDWFDNIFDNWGLTGWIGSAVKTG